MEFSSKRQTSPGSKRESGLNNTHSESISPSMFSDFITDRQVFDIDRINL